MFIYMGLVGRRGAAFSFIQIATDGNLSRGTGYNETPQGKINHFSKNVPRSVNE